MYSTTYSDANESFCFISSEENEIISMWLNTM